VEFTDYCKRLEAKIQDSYEEGVSTETAEKLAGEFLSAMIRLADEIKVQSLDARMKKSGVKALKSAIYLDIVQKSDKKPTESHITATIDSDTVIGESQNRLDCAEVSVDHLERYYDIFYNAHLHFRSIAKGKFEG
jgi:NurA-like 5'-3' nuclease